MALPHGETYHNAPAMPCPQRYGSSYQQRTMDARAGASTEHLRPTEIAQTKTAQYELGKRTWREVDKCFLCKYCDRMLVKITNDEITE